MKLSKVKFLKASREEKKCVPSCLTVEIYQDRSKSYEIFIVLKEKLPTENVVSRKYRL
jgi:hypothetical protein